MGHNSTLLYEAIYYDVLPLRINDNRINHFNYIDDRFINNVGFNLDKLKVYLSTNNSNKLTFLQKKIWKYHLHGFPKKNNYELNSIFS